MSRGEIVEKLDTFIAEHTEMTEECHAVYLMVELRKLIDHTDTAARYPALKFYSDWTVHTRKDRITAEMRQIIEAMYSEAVAEIENRDQLTNRDRLRDFAYMTELKSDVTGILAEHHISSALTSEPGSWMAFVGLLVKVLENQPIVEPTAEIASVSFEPANRDCVISRITFRTPIRGHTHYDYMNAY